jgi:hypothetical protein
LSTSEIAYYTCCNFSEDQAWEESSVKEIRECRHAFDPKGEAAMNRNGTIVTAAMYRNGTIVTAVMYQNGTIATAAMKRSGTIVTRALNLVGTAVKIRNEVLVATKVSQWV